MKKLFKKNPGTTLVEITLYFAIVGAILMSAMVFALEIMSLTASSQNFAELQANQDFYVQKISETIQEADSVDLTASVFDDPNGILSLKMPSSSESPTRFYLVDNDVYIQKGSNSEIQLNSNTVVFNSMKFTRVVGDKAPDQVIIDAEMSPLHTDLVEINQDFKIHLAVSLRR
jgi:hypothetical protein